MLPGCKPGQRIGRIKTSSAFDAVLLVLLDENFDALAIYEGRRAAVLAELARPGSKARNVRGALAVNAFKRIGLEVWRREVTK
jgi:hypothetical protein